MSGGKEGESARGLSEKTYTPSGRVSSGSERLMWFGLVGVGLGADGSAVSKRRMISICITPCRMESSSFSSPANTRVRMVFEERNAYPPTAPIVWVEVSVEVFVHEVYKRIIVPQSSSSKCSAVHDLVQFDVEMRIVSLEEIHKS